MITQEEVRELFDSQRRKQELAALMRQAEKRHAKLETALMARLASRERVEKGALVVRPKPVYRLVIDWKAIVATLKGDTYVARLEKDTAPKGYPHLVVEPSEPALD